MKIDQVKLCEKGEELVIFRPSHANRRAAEDRIVAKHQPRGLKQKGLAIGVGVSGVIEVGPVLDPDSGSNYTFDHDLRVRWDFEIDGFASKSWTAWPCRPPANSNSSVSSDRQRLLP